MKFLLIQQFLEMLLLIAIGIIIMEFVNGANLKAYNKHMCAVYGYREDCKTPLPENERLK
ncbi:MAG: hypothetical protein KGI72_04975 [Patescibacteria group bacterium]|nr:hypothetical protein [Patescibacteria group bacterium]MDE2015846.1 hypothetical protein [Patescibacteria group bacterium]